MAPSTRRRLSMCFVTLLALSSSCWMFFGPGPLSLGYPVSGILPDLRLLVAQNGALLDKSKHSLAKLKEGIARIPALGLPTLVELDSASYASADDGHATLGIASEIYVVSLAHRVDRRATMERLRQALGLRWTYVSAVKSDDSVVSEILDHLRTARETGFSQSDDGHADYTLGERFAWPDDIDLLARSRTPLGFADADLWATSALGQQALSLASANLENPDSMPDDLSPAPTPLTCATRNFTSGPPYAPSLPAYMLLTPAKVACWYSHLEVIRRIADGGRGRRGAPRGARADVAVVLEDDIDMERDIAVRLRDAWGSLPDEWDIVFLGHCWSDEAHYPALARAGVWVPALRLHPAYAPKCTHAYALTRTGARRALLHLRHAPFAYSRALDQALAWLVLSGRLRAFSAVPSVVVQRKVDGSDIDAGGGGMGSGWREHLENGVFGR